jgi:hypothetical protein
MKKLLMLLLLFFLVACKPTDDSLLRDTLSGMGSYSYLDTEFESEYSGDSFNGEGFFVLVYEDSINAAYFAENRVALIELTYDTKLFKDDIKITMASLTYTDYELEVYVEVEFYEEPFDGGHTMDDYVELLESLDVEDIREILADSHFLDKK